MISAISLEQTLANSIVTNKTVRWNFLASVGILEKTNKREKREMELSGIVETTNNEGSIMPRSKLWTLKNLSKGSEKVVFLNEKNLEILKGYKAYVQMNRQGEIHMIITGLSKESSKSLFDNLDAMKTADVISDNK